MPKKPGLPSDQRSTVKRAGRTVTDPEVLSVEHDELLLTLYKSAAQVCDGLLGLEAAALADLANDTDASTKECLAQRIKAIEALLAPEFTYAAWKHGDMASSAPAQPSPEVRAAAQAALATLKLKIPTIDRPSLAEATRIQPRQVLLRAPLTSTTEHPHRYEKKVTDVGYVDLQVSYYDPNEIRITAALEVAGEQRIALGYPRYNTQDALLRELRAIAAGAKVTYSAAYKDSSPSTVLFTVRTGEWTAAEVVEELRNLSKTDQGERAAAIVLVAQEVDPLVASVIRDQGFFVVEGSDLGLASET